MFVNWNAYYALGEFSFYEYFDHKFMPRMAKKSFKEKSF